MLKNVPPSCECNYKYVKKGAEDGGSDRSLNLRLLTATGGFTANVVNLNNTRHGAGGILTCVEACYKVQISWPAVITCDG